MTDLADDRVTFGVLGPLRATRGAAQLSLGPERQRLVLATLLVHANRPVGRDQLIELVWGPVPPTYAVNLVQKHVSSLRRVFEPVRCPRTPSLLAWTEAGYQLTVPAGCLDLHLFDGELGHARVARVAGDLPVAAAALRRALLLWRGPACDGLTSPAVDAYREALAERRLCAVEDRIEIELLLGEHVDLVSELRVLVSEHPLRERLRGLLMTVLHRTGRQAEALTVYQQARSYLREELGVEPNAALRELHLKILVDDVSLASSGPHSSGPAGLTPPGAAPAGPAPATAVLTGAPAAQVEHRMPAPAQLPHGMPDFTGRDAELARLSALLPGADDGVVIAAVTGTAGVGKTALAVHWAHQVRGQFPDGQLYVNLKGFDRGGRAMPPAEAVRGFLDALAVPPQRIPLTLDAQAALYRSLLAGRRFLVLLDNAADAAQVRALLPGSPGSLVVVTSRDRLPRLVADGAHPVAVDLMSADEARQFVSRRLGGARVDAERGAVERIVARCARLPLALAIAAARAATFPNLPLTALVDELERAQGGLDAFDGDEPDTDVRGVFSWSYQRLSPAASRLFRLLSLHPAADFGLGGAASLAGRPTAAARTALTELVRAHLATERAPGRYGLHDLLRAYAAELAASIDPADERAAAFRRMLEHYLYAAHMAHRQLEPSRESLALVRPGPDVHPVELAGPTAAMDWFGVEHPVLLSLLDEAVATGLDAPAVQLAGTLATFLHRRGHGRELATSQSTALTAARRLGDSRGEAEALRGLGCAYTWLRRYDDARPHFDQALAGFGALGDHAGQAYTHHNIAWLLEQTRRPAEALGHAREALRLFEAAHQRTGQADALNAIGWFEAQLGDLPQALEHCQRALALHQATGHRTGEAHTWDSLGYAHQQLGQRRQAVASYERAIELWRDLGDRYYEAVTLTRLGDAHLAAEQLDEADAAWRQALAIFDDYQAPDGGQVQVRLSGLAQRRHRPRPAEPVACAVGSTAGARC